jgi:hypothetical protein
MEEPMSREPLATVAVPASIAIAVLAFLGIHLTTDQTDALTYLLGVGAPILGPLLVWAVGRLHVTPVSQPQDADGNNLVPASLLTEPVTGPTD